MKIERKVIAMRITTQMLNESARKAGMPVNNTSLLNYVNRKGQGSTLLDALNRKKETAQKIEQKSNYEKLDKEADKLTQSAGGLLKEGENSIFEQEKENGDNQAVCDSIEKFFESYNSTLKELRNNSNTMNDFYRQMLTEAGIEEKESLSEIGITFAKDGTAKVDKEKVKAADLETLERMFGKESDFVGKVQFLSTRISDNAEVNIKSLGNSYNTSGSLYSAVGNNRYEFWR